MQLVMTTVTVAASLRAKMSGFGQYAARKPNRNCNEPVYDDSGMSNTFW